jgi:chromosome segregation ATPase
MQSIDSLRELNAKFLAEIAELRKENAELKDKNTEIPDLKRKFAEIESEKVELKARIAELLRQAVEESKRRDVGNAELKARIEELEKSKADSSAENVRRDVEFAELKAEVVKLIDNNEEIKQQTQDISSGEVVNIPSSVVDQHNNAEQSAFQPSLPVSYQKSLEDEKTDVFLDDVDKKRVSVR